MSLKCDRCKDLKCKQAERNCKGFLDKVGKWIGGVVNAAGNTFRFEDENDYEYEISFKVFSRIVKNIHPGILHCFFFSPDKLELLSLLKEVKTSSDCKMLKLLTFDNLFSPLRHSR